MLCLELKTSKNSSFTFERQDFIDKNKKQSFMIKKHQIDGLLKASKHRGIIAGFIINFSNKAHTYFIHIDDFMNMINSLDKKSFNEKDLLENNLYLIGQTIKRVKYDFHIERFIKDIQKKYNYTI